MRLGLTLLIAATLPLVACGTDSGADDGHLTVAAAFYPLEEVVRQVGGDAVDVITIVPPGEEAHEYEPTPRQLTELAEADVVFYLGQGFQPNVEKAIQSLPGSVRKVDLLDGLDLLPITQQLPGIEGQPEGQKEEASLGDGSDPHVWLSPVNMQAMTTTVVDELVGVAPDLVTTVRDNGSAFDTSLGALDGEFRAGLATCATRYLVSSHRAFAYLADAYELIDVAIAGISPSEEPSAKTLESIAAFVEDNGVTTIFFEQNLPDDLARTLADEVGASTAVLDTIESPSQDQLDSGADYESLMGANLAALRTGLGCS
jgi:zinc transport system substrate-binding protein